MLRGLSKIQNYGQGFSTYIGPEPEVIWAEFKKKSHRQPCDTILAFFKELGKMWYKSPCSLLIAEWGHLILLSYSKSIESVSRGGSHTSIFSGHCNAQTGIGTTVCISQELTGYWIRKKSISFSYINIQMIVGFLLRI